MPFEFKETRGTGPGSNEGHQMRGQGVDGSNGALHRLHSLGQRGGWQSPGKEKKHMKTMPLAGKCSKPVLKNGRETHPRPRATRRGRSGPPWVAGTASGARGFARAGAEHQKKRPLHVEKDAHSVAARGGEHSVGEAVGGSRDWGLLNRRKDMRACTNCTCDPNSGKRKLGRVPESA